MKKVKHKKRHRNNGGGPAVGPPRQRPNVRRHLRRGYPPDLWTTVAAIAGGAGSAVLGGLVVSQKLLPPEAMAVGMIGVGGATAYLADGNARVVGNSMASAGAGQLALALMARRALAVQNQPPQQFAQTAPQAATLPPAAPLALPAPAPPSMAEHRRAAHGGGYVTDAFRDAATELDMLDENGWRMDARDAAVMDADVYDADELAAA